MAIELATAYVSVVPSAKGLQANLAKELAPISGIASAQGAQAGKELGGNFTKGIASAGIVGTFKTQVGGLANVAKAALATAGIGVFVRQSINAASDLNESQSKVNVVFREGAKDVEAWSKSAATGLGISKQEALEAAGTFGNFLISMGLIPEKAQDMSVSLVQLASDLASFNNTSPEDALLAIRSGLAGEIEPLRRYGVALSANRIEQEAQAAGLNKTSAEMSAAEKATFAYKIILEDTTLAQGDFERTSGGLANQQRILAARLKDAEAQLGGFLIPTLLTGAKAAVAFGHGLAVANKATDGWLGTLGGAALLGGTVFLTINKLGSVVRGMVGAFTAQSAATATLTGAQTANAASATADAVAQGELAAASGTAAVAMEGEAASAGLLGTTLKGTLAPALAAVAVGFLGGKKAGDEINKLLTGAPPKVDELTASLLKLEKGQQGAFDFSKFADDLKGQVTIGDKSGPGEAAKEFFGAFTKNAHQAKADIGPLNDALKEVLRTEGVDAATRAYGLMFQGLRDQGVAVDTLTGDFGPFQSALDLARAKEEDTSGTTKTLTADLKGLNDAFAKQAAPLGIADQLDQAQQAVDDLNQLKLDALGQGQKSIDAARAEERARESLADAYRSEGDAAENLAEAKANLARFDGKTDSRIRDLERQQITDRVVTTPEEARQKEIDLLKFDEDATQRRQDLQKQVASAEDGVASATGRVRDAQQAVSEASAARRQVQVDAAAAIDGAERKAQEAILAAGDAVIKAKDDQLIGNEALSLYLQLLDDLSGKVAPGSPLAKRIDDFLNKLSMASMLKQSLGGQLGPAPFVGPGGVPPTVFQPPALPVGPPPAAKPTIDFHPTTTIHASDIPTQSAIDTMNRKQGIKLAALIPA